MQTMKIQRAPNGRVLGACVALPAEIMERYANREHVEFEITDVIGGIMLKVVE